MKNTVIFHSALPPVAVADALRRSIDQEWLTQLVMPWFIRPFLGKGSRPVLGTVEGNTVQLQKRRLFAGYFAPTFYGRWEPEGGGTRIAGHFDLAPTTRLGLRLAVLLILAMAAFGVVLNLLDIVVGTHFTTDPKVGLVISISFVPFTIIAYGLVKIVGRRTDKFLLSFVEQALAAQPISGESMKTDREPVR